MLREAGHSYLMLRLNPFPGLTRIFRSALAGIRAVPARWIAIGAAMALFTAGAGFWAVRSWIASKQPRHDRIATIQLYALHKDQMPKQVRISPDGNLALIPCMSSDTVAIFSTKTMRRLASVKSPARMPVEVTFASDSRRAYVQCLAPPVILELNLGKLSIIRVSPPHGVWPKIIEFTPDFRQLWVTDWTGHTVDIIDPKSLNRIRSIKVARTPRGIGFLKSQPRAYVANFGENDPGNGTITEIDTSTMKVIRTFGNLGGSPRHVSVSPDDRFVYVSNMQKNLVHVIDTKKDAIISGIPVGPEPKTIDLTPDGRYLYVADFNSGTAQGSITVCDAIHRKVIDTLPAGKGTTGLDVSPDGRSLWVTNIWDNTITVYRINR